MGFAYGASLIPGVQSTGFAPRASLIPGVQLLAWVL